MFDPMGAQALILAQSILLGAGIGAFYDVLRALRRQFHAGRGLTALYDAVFWAGVLFALFEYGITLAAGQGRYFVLAGAAAGMGIYFALLSAPALSAASLLFSAVAFVGDKAMRAAQLVKRLAEKLGLAKKIRECAKKFDKTSSIFRGKGLK